MYKKANPDDKKIIILRFGDYFNPKYKKVISKLKYWSKKIEDLEEELTLCFYETTMYGLDLNKKKK